MVLQGVLARVHVQSACARAGLVMTRSLSTEGHSAQYPCLIETPGINSHHLSGLKADTHAPACNGCRLPCARQPVLAGRLAVHALQPSCSRSSCLCSPALPQAAAAEAAAAERERRKQLAQKKKGRTKGDKDKAAAERAAAEREEAERAKAEREAAALRAAEERVRRAAQKEALRKQVRCVVLCLRCARAYACVRVCLLCLLVAAVWCPAVCNVQLCRHPLQRCCMQGTRLSGLHPAHTSNTGRLDVPFMPRTTPDHACTLTPNCRRRSSWPDAARS